MRVALGLPLAVRPAVPQTAERFGSEPSVAWLGTVSPHVRPSESTGYRIGRVELAYDRSRISADRKRAAAEQDVHTRQQLRQQANAAPTHAIARCNTHHTACHIRMQPASYRAGSTPRAAVASERVGMGCSVRRAHLLLCRGALRRVAQLLERECQQLSLR